MDTLLAHYAEIITDPAHSLVELTFTIVVDVIFLGAVWPWVKRHIHRDISQTESDVTGTPLVVRDDGLYHGKQRLLTFEEFCSMLAGAKVDETLYQERKEPKEASDEVPV